MLNMIVGIIAIIGIMGLPVISHLPIWHLSQKQRQEVLQKGLIHYTNPANIGSILNTGLIGYESDYGMLEKLLGKLIWSYGFTSEEDLDEKHSTLYGMRLKSMTMDKTLGLGKAEDGFTEGHTAYDPEKFDACLRLSGFTENELGKLRVRRGIFGDSAIVFKGSYLRPEDIFILKEW